MVIVKARVMVKLVVKAQACKIMMLKKKRYFDDIPRQYGPNL